jgi:hypothetical protein
MTDKLSSEQAALLSLLDRVQALEDLARVQARRIAHLERLLRESGNVVPFPLRVAGQLKRVRS